LGNNKPVKTKDWIRFLVYKNCVKKRHKGTSHEHWKCPNCFRTIVFRTKDKEIPPLHLKTNLESLGMTLKDLYNWIERKKN